MATGPLVYRACIPIGIHSTVQPETQSHGSTEPVYLVVPYLYIYCLARGLRLRDVQGLYTPMCIRTCTYREPLSTSHAGRCIGMVHATEYIMPEPWYSWMHVLWIDSTSTYRAIVGPVRIGAVHPGYVYPGVPWLRYDVLR